MYYKEELEPHKKRGIQLLNLRNLTRQQESISSIAAQTKLQLQSILVLVFTEYRGVFSNLYSKVSLETLLHFPTSEDVLCVSESTITDKISELCTRRSEKWAAEKALKIREAALRNPFQNNLYQSHVFNLKMFINIVLQYQEHLSKLSIEIDTLSKEIEEYQIISLSLVSEKRLRQQSFPKLER